MCAGDWRTSHIRTIFLREHRLGSIRWPIHPGGLLRGQCALLECCGFYDHPGSTTTSPSRKPSRWYVLAPDTYMNTRTCTIFHIQCFYRHTSYTIHDQIRHVCMWHGHAIWLATTRWLYYGNTYQVYIVMLPCAKLHSLTVYNLVTHW
jgi:hypothetical protein